MYKSIFNLNLNHESNRHLIQFSFLLLLTVIFLHLGIYLEESYSLITDHGYFNSSGNTGYGGFNSQSGFSQGGEGVSQGTGGTPQGNGGGGGGFHQGVIPQDNGNNHNNEDNTLPYDTEHHKEMIKKSMREKLSNHRISCASKVPYDTCLDDKFTSQEHEYICDQVMKHKETIKPSST